MPIVVERPRTRECDAIARFALRIDADRERAVAVGVVDEPRVRRRDRRRTGIARRSRDHDRLAERAVTDTVLAAAREVQRAIDDDLPRGQRPDLADLLAGIRRVRRLVDLYARVDARLVR